MEFDIKTLEFHVNFITTGLQATETLKFLVLILSSIGNKCANSTIEFVSGYINLSSNFCTDPPAIGYSHLVSLFSL